MNDPPADLPIEEDAPILLEELSELSRKFTVVAVVGRASVDEEKLMKEAGESTCLFTQKRLSDSKQ